MSATITNPLACTTDLQLPTVLWGQPAEKYTVKLTADDGAGGTHSVEHTITVQPEPNEPPVAMFDLPAIADSGQTIPLASSSTNKEPSQTVTCKWEIV